MEDERIRDNAHSLPWFTGIANTSAAVRFEAFKCMGNIGWRAAPPKEPVKFFKEYN